MWTKNTAQAKHKGHVGIHRTHHLIYPNSPHTFHQNLEELQSELMNHGLGHLYRILNLLFQQFLLFYARQLFVKLPEQKS